MGYLLLTGATGLLGRYLVVDLLESGHKLALLVRNGKHDSAWQRVEGILQHWEKQHGRTLPRPVVMEGDICRPMLGLNCQQMRWLSENCDAVMHSAASLKFHDDGHGEPWRSNIHGTENVLALCESTGIRRLHYVSTAYVCGLRTGTIFESELNEGQEFRNDYEKSKLLAEELVRRASHLDELTVYRPAVISGDSRTGYTNTYHGIYLYLRMMALLVPRQPIGPDGRRQTALRVPMTGDERRNVVPVDWVSKVMTRLYSNPAAHGHTFHLAPDTCMTPRDAIEAGYSYFNSSGVQWVGDLAIDPATYNGFEAEMLPALAMYHNYERTDPAFDCSQVKRFAGDLPCPVIDEAMIHTYIRYGEQDRWGKRRQGTPRVRAYAHCIFDQVPPVDVDQAAVAKIGLDIRGPGGGQWTLQLCSSGSLQCAQGLQRGLESVVTMSGDEFFDIMDVPADAFAETLIEQFFPMSFKPSIMEATESSGSASLRTSSAPPIPSGSQ